MSMPFFEALERYVAGLTARAPRAALTADDRDEGLATRDDAEKRRSIEVILDTIPAGRLLDVGAGSGWASLLAAGRGHTVVAMDRDDCALADLYGRAMTAGLPVLPVRMDVLWPTGSSGMGLDCPAAPERLRADTVLALGVVHHLVCRQGAKLESVARVLNLFAERRVVVEFVPREDAIAGRWPFANHPWYTADSFTTAMRPYFRLVRTLPSSPTPRSILVFERDSP
jgi:hypothetical protein